MRVGILGLGHVGLVNLCGFAKKGFLTIGFDLPDVVSSLKSKRIPFFEPGLEDLFESCFPKISLTDDLNVFLDNAEVIFLCVNTPYIEKIGMDISNITQSVERIAAKANGWKLIVEKSTVPISTHRVLESIAHGKNIEFACCPEFLREGQAIQDFFETDRIVIGTSSKKARKVLKQIFSRFDCEKLYCSIEAAELIKMASNAFLAMRISFINLISDLCELYEADITEVSQGIGLDHRIGTEYLEAGIGFGGSCLPKDLLALRFILRSHNINDRLLQSICEINDLRIQHVLHLLMRFGITGSDNKVTLFGLTFKGGSDDCRESQAIKLANEIKKLGVKISCYDPYFSNTMATSIGVCEDPYEAVLESECLIVLNDMKSLSKLDFSRIAASMKTQRLIDCKNIIDRKTIDGFEYFSFGNYMGGKSITANSSNSLLSID